VQLVCKMMGCGRSTSKQRRIGICDQENPHEPGEVPFGFAWRRANAHPRAAGGMDGRLPLSLAPVVVRRCGVYVDAVGSSCSHGW
jgi:hypothetical protein